MTQEKTLKAYLVFKNYPIMKTHDLIQLLEMCMSFLNERVKGITSRHIK